MSNLNDSDWEWTGFREKCRRVIFLHDRPIEKLFDVLLIAAIMLSLVVVMLESVASLRARFGDALYILEWIFTIVFTIEYAVRLYVARRAVRYARSFFGIVDLLSLLPTYLDLIIPGAHYLMTLRVLRVLRIFRVLKMAQFVGEANQLAQAIRSSARKIAVFIFSVVTLVCILGSIMYLVEGPENGYTSIPKSVYWAIVTLTTVGYGDISPQTTLGQFFASIIMITGYGIIAVPTGIVSAEIARVSKAVDRGGRCDACGQESHEREAVYCRLCGGKLSEHGSPGSSGGASR